MKDNIALLDQTANMPCIAYASLRLALDGCGMIMRMQIILSKTPF